MSTTVASFVLLHSIVQTCSLSTKGGRNGELFVCFVDFKKAFDSVIRIFTLNSTDLQTDYLSWWFYFCGGGYLQNTSKSRYMPCQLLADFSLNVKVMGSNPNHYFLATANVENLHWALDFRKIDCSNPIWICRQKFPFQWRRRSRRLGRGGIRTWRSLAGCGWSCWWLTWIS